MKNIKYIGIVFSLICATMACNDLNLPPINIIQDKDVFNSESGITSYIVRLYNELPIEDFRFTRNGFDQFNTWPALGNCTGELLLCQTDMVWDSPNGDWWQCWRYGSIRNVNYFLQTFPEYSQSYTEDQCNKWLGEAHFIRAYYYFAMVKRYGGVPIIKEVQNYPEQSMEELRVQRDSEQDAYDFVAEELDKAIELLPEKREQKGRVNKYVAYALKSRVMLYAGSIAQYGKMQLDGLLGIPSADAVKYYQASYDAARALEGHYTLYRKYTDKYENYWHLFLDQDSPENIFCEYYVYPQKVHSWDAHHIPYQMRGSHGYSSRFCPTLEFVEMFDDVNGNPGTMKIMDENGKPIRFENTMDAFKEKEPRLRGSVIFPGDIYKGESIEIQKGVYPTYSENTEPLMSTNSNDLYQGHRIIGKSGMGHQEMTSTGFCIRKYQNPDIVLANVIQDRSEQAWIDIRYAEVLLNKAEAAFQLGKIDEALTAINDIRDRAGAKLYTKEELTFNKIQKERRMELAFENHTYWDLRRWRIADKEINNVEYTALCPYYIFDEGKFIFKREKVGGRYTFDVKVNYEKIPSGEIAKNENLVQNPGY